MVKLLLVFSLVFLVNTASEAAVLECHILNYRVDLNALTVTGYDIPRKTVVKVKKSDTQYSFEYVNESGEKIKTSIDRKTTVMYAYTVGKTYGTGDYAIPYYLRGYCPLERENQY